MKMKAVMRVWDMRMIVLVQMSVSRFHQREGGKWLVINIGSQDMIQSGRKSTHGWWIIYMYVEGEGLYCKWCQKHNAVACNKQGTWTIKPCVFFREDKIKSHSCTCAHQEAAQHQADAEESARSRWIVLTFQKVISIDRKAFLCALKVIRLNYGILYHTILNLLIQSVNSI